MPVRCLAQWLACSYTCNAQEALGNTVQWILLMSAQWRWGSLPFQSLLIKLTGGDAAADFTFLTAKVRMFAVGQGCMDAFWPVSLRHAFLKNVILNSLRYLISLLKEVTLLCYLRVPQKSWMVNKNNSRWPRSFQNQGEGLEGRSGHKWNTKPRK